jgi:HEPN domain-containing protein
MVPEAEELIRQAEYEVEDAVCLYEGHRYPKAVFSLHLAIEKALKGLSLHCNGRIPRKTHSLYYLIRNIPLSIPDQYMDLIDELEGVSVKVRYPPMLDILLLELSDEQVASWVDVAREFLQWIRGLYL